MDFAIGTCAHPGSGQDTIADLIVERHPAIKKYSIGDIFRDIATKRGIPHTRENLQSIRKECDEKHGDREYLPRRLSGRILSEGHIPIITGMRTEEELKVFNESFDKFYLIFVYADENIRFDRLVNRAEARDPKTFDEFMAQMKREETMYDLGFLENKADYRIECNMTLGELKASADDILKRLSFLYDH